MNEKFSKVLADTNAVESFLKNPVALFDGSINEPILLVTENPGKALQKFKARLHVVVAGGGLVFNERDELLMIFRRGKWDLAKGKLDKGEKLIDCAVREVEEETGVRIQQVETEPLMTYHAYYHKGKDCLKETGWYIMQAEPNQTKLIPQTEEDIEHVLWVPRTEIAKYKDGCYLLIWELIKGYAL